MQIVFKDGKDTRVPVSADRGSEGVRRAKSLTEEEKRDQREKLSFMQPKGVMALPHGQSKRMKSPMPTLSQAESTAISYNYDLKQRRGPIPTLSDWARNMENDVAE